MKIITIKIVSAISVLITALSISSCNNAKKIETELYAMNTIIKLSFYKEDGSQLVSEEINRIEKLLSVTDTESDVGQINCSGGQGVSVSKDTIKVLNTAKNIYNDTNGCFDPSVYPVVRLWGFTTDEYKVPDDNEIDALVPYVDYSRVRIDGSSVIVPKGMQLDLGGIAKGYAGERCRDILVKNGITSAVLSIGGNVQTVGLKPDGSRWKIGLKNPDGGENLCSIEVGECAVVTSGGYERYFEKDGKVYHHIIDPKTGKPASGGYKSVTVICQNGAQADALSTAFFVGGEKLIGEYLKNHKNVNVILYTDNNEFYISRAIEDSITFQTGKGQMLHYID